MLGALLEISKFICRTAGYSYRQSISESYDRPPWHRLSWFFLYYQANI